MVVPPPPIDASYFNTIPTERSPLKRNAFFRTSRSSRDKKKWCVCGRQLVFFKDAGECYACTECGHTEYLEEQKQQQAPTTATTNSSSGIGSIDGLSDSQTRPNRGATKFRSMDPRRRFLKPKSQLDEEMQRLVDEQGVTIIRYEERLEEDSQTLSSDELRANR